MINKCGREAQLLSKSFNYIRVQNKHKHIKTLRKANLTPTPMPANK
jgi:hypothetical protein